MSVDTESLSCQELVELVTDYLEGALDGVTLSRFEAHIRQCSGCAAYLEQLRQTIRVVGSITPADLTPDAERTLLHAFRDWAAGS